MIGLKFSAAKDGFFDREKVINAVGKATVKIFKEFGRAVRAIAQKSIVISDKASSPGQPPHGHKTGWVKRVSKSKGTIRYRNVSYLREYIFYSWDSNTKSVVIGPAKLGGTVSSASLPALEYGGPSTIVTHGKIKKVNIAARPFMGPAAAAEIPKLPAMWQNSVKF